MTVAELIEVLQRFSPNKPVAFEDSNEHIHYIDSVLEYANQVRLIGE